MRKKISLSEDAIMEILLRCPVKSLLRLKTVSKLWLSIISDPQFIQSHSQMASHKKPLILVDTQTSDLFPNLFQYLFLPKGIKEFTHFVGCVNGIVCLDEYGVIYLWNPSIRRYRRISKPKIRGNMYSALGFGYDSISNDFKLVCLQSHCHDSTKLAKLFSKNEGVWRKIGVNIPLPSHMYDKCQFIDGFLYFEPMDHENELISFDLHTQLFGVVPLPCCAQQSRSALFDFKGSLAVMFMDSIGDGSVDQDVSLWALEHCAEVSWIKRFTIEAADFCWIEKPLFPYGLSAILYLGDGIFYGRNPVSHIWYNYQKKEGKHVGILNGKCPRTLKYTESLFWFESTGLITSNNCEEERRRSKRLNKYAGEVGNLEGIKGRTGAKHVAPRC